MELYMSSIFGLKKIEREIMPRIMKKATQSPNNFSVAAAAFSKKGNLLGVKSNSHYNYIAIRRGGSKHAEASLIAEFGRKIDTIYLVRIGKDFSRLPIHPCENCQKIANKFGIKIIPVHIEFGYKSTDIYP